MSAEEDASRSASCGLEAATTSGDDERSLQMITFEIMELNVYTIGRNRKAHYLFWAALVITMFNRPSKGRNFSGMDSHVFLPIITAFYEKRLNSPEQASVHLREWSAFEPACRSQKYQNIICTKLQLIRKKKKKESLFWAHTLFNGSTVEVVSCLKYCISLGIFHCGSPPSFPARINEPSYRSKQKLSIAYQFLQHHL